MNSETHGLSVYADEKPLSYSHIYFSIQQRNNFKHLWKSGKDPIKCKERRRLTAIKLIKETNQPTDHG